MFNLTIFLLLNGFCYLCRPDRRRGECQSHGHLGGDTVAVCWGGVTESSPRQHPGCCWLGFMNACPWVHLLLFGGCFLFLRKEILQHHSWLPHLPGFLGQEVKRHNRRHSTVWQQVRKQHLHQRAADSREKVLLDHPKWTPKVWTEKPSAASSLCRADPSWTPSSMSVWGEITFYSFAELLFDQEIGAHSSSWEVGRSPREEQREGPASSAPRSAGRTSARQPRAASKSQAAENDSCQVNAKWCADSQPPIVCVLGQLPSPSALAKAGGRSLGWLTSALLKLQQRRRLQGNVLFSFPPIRGCAGDVGKLLRSSREALVSWWQLAISGHLADCTTLKSWPRLSAPHHKTRHGCL